MVHRQPHDAEQAAEHRPARQRVRRANQHRACPGAQGQPCRFSPQQPGRPAKLNKKGRACMFCSEAGLQAAMRTPHGKGRVTATLRALAGLEDQRFKEAALRRIGQWAPEEEAGFRQKLEQKRKPSTKEKWTECLAHRRSTDPPPDEPARKKFRKEILDDQRSARNNFFPNAPRQPRASAEEAATIPDNGTGLKEATSEVGRQLQKWEEEGSFGMCSKCKAVQPRKLYETDMNPKKQFQAELGPSACTWCKSAHQYYRPRPEDVPRKLRGLSSRSTYTRARCSAHGKDIERRPP